MTTSIHKIINNSTYTLKSCVGSKKNEGIFLKEDLETKSVWGTGSSD